MLLRTLAALAALLLVTGLWLTSRYVPGPGRAWTVGAAHEVHRFSGYASAVVAALLALDVALGAAARHARRAWTRIGASVVLVVAVGVALVSGPKLAWNQLALWAVTRGDQIRGIFPSDEVRFVLADGGELSRSSFQRWAWIHVLVVPLVVVACFVVLALRARRARRDNRTDAIAVS